MNSRSLPVLPFDISTVSEDRMLALADLLIRYRKLIHPQDPQMSRETMAKIYLHTPAYLQFGGWAAWDQERVAAYAITYHNMEDPSDRTMFVQLVVDPEYRRQGLGREFLRQIYIYACQNGRELLQADTFDRDPDGAAFLKRVGARQGQEMEINQLDLNSLDREMLRQWQERAVQRAPNFTLGYWENAVPEEDLDQVAEIINEIIDTSPHEGLDLPESHLTGAQIRQNIDNQILNGTQYLGVFVREKDSHLIAGYSEAYWHPERATILNQSGTGVRMRFRNLGLGRWLKAAMLERVLDKLPQVRYARTGNANSNAPMLKINYELGFRHYITETFWQMALPTVRAYLDSSSPS